MTEQANKMIELIKGCRRDNGRYGLRQGRAAIAGTQTIRSGRCSCTGSLWGCPAIRGSDTGTTTAWITGERTCTYARTRAARQTASFLAQIRLAYWSSQMTHEDRESLRTEMLKGSHSQDLLDREAAESQFSAWFISGANSPRKYS